jgi:hypothetical protein
MKARPFSRFVLFHSFKVSINNKVMRVCEMPPGAIYKSWRGSRKKASYIKPIFKGVVPGINRRTGNARPNPPWTPSGGCSAYTVLSHPLLAIPASLPAAGVAKHMDPPDPAAGPLLH